MQQDKSQLPVSVVILTFNEIKNIERCLRSVSDFAEVLVIDSESSDGTQEKAQALGARVISKSWEGFQKQRQFATDQAKNNWVLSLDADEELTSPLKEEIAQAVSSNGLYEAYEMPRLSFHLGCWIRYGGWYPDRQTRLFKKSKCRWQGGEVHEYLEAIHLGRFKNHLNHYVFQSLSHQVLTNDKYSTLGAQKLLRKGSQYSFLRMIFKPLGKFIECYFFKLGFLDGRPGFIIAVGASYSIFLKFAKIWESQIEKKKS